MSLSEQVYSVLIVSASNAFNSMLTPLLSKSQFEAVRIEASISSAKRTLAERAYDFVVINSPLPDDAGVQFAMEVAERNTSVVLLMIRSELYSVTYNRVTEQGVYLLPKPVHMSVISQAIDWMIVTRERLKKFEKKTMSIEEKMQEIRIVNRAKWILIEQLKMQEHDAHRYIEKKAMDTCMSKYEIAEEIIKMYT